jgi:hypothetical protein
MPQTSIYIPGTFSFLTLSVTPAFGGCFVGAVYVLIVVAAAEGGVVLPGAKVVAAGTGVVSVALLLQ